MMMMMELPFMKRRYGAKFQENENCLRWVFWGKQWCSNWRANHLHVRTGVQWKISQRERGCGIYIFRTSIRWLQIWDDIFVMPSWSTEKFRAW
jgi:hypothetical protein